jgi:hypothetical protein
VFLSSDFTEFISEARGGQYLSSFYDAFSDIESLARSYSVQRDAAKAADFHTHELATFIDDQFYNLTDTKKRCKSSVCSFSEILSFGSSKMGCLF